MIPGSDVDIDRLVREEADRLEMPSLRDIADRAVVMGECWICAGVIACQNPELCGHENGEAPHEVV